MSKKSVDKCRCECASGDISGILLPSRARMMSFVDGQNDVDSFVRGCIEVMQLLRRDSYCKTGIYIVDIFYILYIRLLSKHKTLKLPNPTLTNPSNFLMPTPTNIKLATINYLTYCNNMPIFLYFLAQSNQKQFLYRSIHSFIVLLPVKCLTMELLSMRRSLYTGV